MLSGQLSIALINSPNLCVVSGPVSGVSDFQSRLAEQQVVFRPVRNAHAFHSRMLDPIVDPFVKEIKQVRLRAPRIPFTSILPGRGLLQDRLVIRVTGLTRRATPPGSAMPWNNCGEFPV